MANTICPVCGLDQGFLIWDEEKNIPSYSICPCCGTEFGVDDLTLENIKRRRKQWMEEGGKWLTGWHQRRFKPDNWDMEKQLMQIPEKYR